MDIYLKESLGQKGDINTEENNYKKSFFDSNIELGELITVTSTDVNKAILEMFRIDDGQCIKVLESEAFVGRNGSTKDKHEGDGKTPVGRFNLGIAFGMHDAEELNISKDLKYIKINKNLYWVDDINSKFYNQLVDISKVKKDWESAEHLIEYPKQYEYAIEIKANPDNIPGKGSAIFLHCSVERPTAGCVAIDKMKMFKILQMIKKNTCILIKDI